MKVVWTRQAREDLRGIGRYIARDNRVAAQRWVARLFHRAKQAGDMPFSGRMVPERGREDLRELIEGNYRIIYRVRTERVDILAVFEAHRLFPLA